ncbi:TonB-dependent receptor [Candidatus Saganbacteria bacterium]|nr:TonB-dependent receptor [Candidatus Saganbacteria bacterium]
MLRLSAAFVGLLLLFSFAFASEVPSFRGEEVVVTALRLPRLKSQIPWDVTIITRKEIEASGVYKLGDILRSLPGMLVKADRDLTSAIQVSFRGSTTQQVLVLWNGARINSPALGSFDLGNLLLTDVERIEVVKSPLSALYGADAVGGVINIITRPATEQCQYDLTAKYGSFSTYNLSLSSSGPNYFFSAAKLGSAGFSDNNDYQGQDFNLRLSKNLDPINIEAGFKQYRADKGVGSSTIQARQTENNTFYDVKVRADSLGLNSTIAQSELDQSYNNAAWGVSSRHQTRTRSLNLEKTAELGIVGAGLFGFEYRRDNSTSTDSGIRLLENRAAYVQDELGVTDTAKLVLGLRYDDNSTYGRHYNPRIGWVIIPRADLNVKLSWGTAFRAPTVNDLYWTSNTYPTSAGGIGTTEGNLTLKPETASSFDLTVERNLGPQSLIKFSYFLSTIKDMIQWANTSSSMVDEFWTPSNVSNANIQGIELEYSRPIFAGLNSFVNFTHQNAKDSGLDNFLVYRPQNRTNAGLNYDNQTGVTANLLVKNIGEQYANPANTSKLEPYTIVDFMAAKELEKWRLKFDAGNLFNTSYVETALAPMPGRKFTLGFDYKW